MSPEVSEPEDPDLSSSTPILEVIGLSKRFDLPGTRLFGPKQTIEVVSNVSFSIGRGEILGLVGESGSGKTTIGRLVMRLLDPTSGTVLFDGTDLTALSGRALRHLRRRFQMVFQDPYSSLNPKMTVGQIVQEPLVIHDMVSGGGEGRERVSRLLERVGLSSHDLDRAPRDFSGGGRQRIGIARAIACNPDLLVADEPIASLDLSIGAQIVNLFSSLNRTEGMSLLFISHDLAVVRYLSDRVAVLYRGHVVESGPTSGVFDHPEHPYTRVLVAPDGVLKNAHPEESGRPALQPRCPFLSRCPDVLDACHRSFPPLWRTGRDQSVLCHHRPAGEAWEQCPEPTLSHSMQGSL